MINQELLSVYQIEFLVVVPAGGRRGKRVLGRMVVDVPLNGFVNEAPRIEYGRAGKSMFGEPEHCHFSVRVKLAKKPHSIGMHVYLTMKCQ